MNYVYTVGKRVPIHITWEYIKTGEQSEVSGGRVRLSTSTSNVMGSIPGGGSKLTCREVWPKSKKKVSV